MADGSTNPLDRTITIAPLGRSAAGRLDRRGVLQVSGAIVDWAVGAADGWHVASREAGGRQSLVDATPVVVTALRVPDGAVEHRCAAAMLGDRPVAVVELRNAAPVAVAVAVVVRNVDAATSGVIAIEDRVIRLDSRPVVWFGRAPSRAIAGRTDAVLDAVAAGVEDPSGGSGVGMEGVDGALAAVFPLPHTATLRLAVALDHRDEGLVDVDRLPPFDNLVAGWHVQTSASPRVDLPEREAETAVAAARRHLLARVGDGRVRRADGSRVDVATSAAMAMALDEHGLHHAARRLLEAALDEQGSDGGFDRERLDATASWLVALDRHRVLSGDDALAARLVEPVASAAHWLHRRHRGSPLLRSTRFFGRGTDVDGLAGKERCAYDARWARRGLDAAAMSLRAVGQTAAAELVDDHVVALVHDMSSRNITDLGPGSGRLEGRPVETLRAALAQGAPCWTWPGELDGDDPGRAASFLRLVRAVLVDDSDDGLDLLPVPIDEWFGAAIAVHELPTAHGRLSFALRWHGERPALLWELERAASAGAVRLSASTLDPGWTSTEPAAEALLAAPVHEHAATDPGPSAGSSPAEGDSFI